MAKKLLATVAHGGDPAADRFKDRVALSIEGLAERYLRDETGLKRKPSTAKLYNHYLRFHVIPRLGLRKAHTITRADVSKLHRDLGARAPVTANRVLATLSGVFTFGQREGLVPSGCNPARGIEQFREQGRERYLSGDELRRLGEALRQAETMGIPWQVDDSKPTAKHAPKAKNRLTKLSFEVTAALRLLLFTGCRLREVLHLEWQHVDLERGLLFLPDSKSGCKAIVLNGPALAILTNLPRVGRFVVPGDNLDKPRSDLKRPWAAVARQAGLEGLRLHDLRHSFASVGAGVSLGLPIIGKLLGHTQASTTQRYAHLDADPLRRASDVIGQRIAAALGEAEQLKKESLQGSRRVCDDDKDRG
jgi:integrase